MWIIYINGEDTTTYQGALDELNTHQNIRGKSKFNISLCRRKSYHITDIEYICSIFDQGRTLVSHLEVLIPKKPLTINNIVEGLKGLQRQFWKEALFVQYDKNKNASLIFPPIPIKFLPEGKKSYVHSLLIVIRKVDVLIHGNLLHATVEIRALILKVFMLINHTVQWHMLTCS